MGTSFVSLREKIIFPDFSTPQKKLDRRIGGGKPMTVSTLAKSPTLLLFSFKDFYLFMGRVGGSVG